MLKKAILVLASLPFFLGASCSITCTECTGWGPICFSPVFATLSDVHCTMELVHEAGATEVDVYAILLDDYGCPVELDDEQSLKVNSQELQGPSLSGGYVQSVDPAAEYVISVHDPTRGTDVTTVDAAPFEITEPNDGAQVSLGGFTLSWSNADTNLKVVITLTQNVFEEVVGKFKLNQDTGSKIFDQDDLTNFVTGADIIINVARIFERDSIAGFKTGELTYERSESISVEPLSQAP
jgi:hypothetical protein